MTTVSQAGPLTEREELAGHAGALRLPAHCGLQSVIQRAVSRRFLRNSSRLFMASMAPLAVGLCLDIFLVGELRLPDNRKFRDVRTARTR